MALFLYINFVMVTIRSQKLLTKAPTQLFDSLMPNFGPSFLFHRAVKLLFVIALVLSYVQSSYSNEVAKCEALFLSQIENPRDNLIKRTSQVFREKFNDEIQALIHYYGYEQTVSKTYINPRGRKESHYAAPSFFKRKIDQLQIFGDQYPELLFHPNIIANTAGFVNFLKALDSIPADPWKALDLYRQSLGKVTVYRGMALTKTELENILTHGIVPKTNRSKDASKIGITYRIMSHAKELTKGQDSSFYPEIISVTSIPEVALSVAAGFTNGKRTPYLFMLKVDKLDLLQPNLNNKDSMVIAQGLFYYFHSKFNITRGDGRTSVVRYGPKVESFIFGKVKPEEILSYESVTSRPGKMNVTSEQADVDLEWPTSFD